MSILITPISDPRPLEPDWVDDSDDDEFSISWTAEYPVWNRELRIYERLEDCGVTFSSLYEAVADALANQKVCTFRITVNGHDSSLTQSSFSDINPPDDTGMFWQIFNASDEGDYSQYEDGLCNGDLLWILLDNIRNPDVLYGDDTFVIDISEYDPTP